MKCYEIINDKGEPALSVRGDCIAAYEVRTWEEGHYTLIHLTGGQTIKVLGDLDKALAPALGPALGGDRESEERLRDRP